MKRERTEAEHQDLLASSGLQIIKIVPTDSRMSMVECVPIYESTREKDKSKVLQDK